MNEIKKEEKCFDAETIKEHGDPILCSHIRDCEHKRNGYTWSNCLCGGRCYPELMDRMRKMARMSVNKQEFGN